MAYDLDAIKQKIADLSGGRNPGKNKNRPKLNWFKPKLKNDGSPNQYEIRFLPYTDSNGQPFQEVSYYDNKDLHERRFVAPAQFGMEDPIFDLISELRQEGTRESWRLMGTLRPKERFYAPIVIRGEEEKGVQIWELNSKILKDIYSVLAHPDYADENMMDPEQGFDFTLTVTDSGKKFGKYVVKNYDVQPRRKPSKLASTKKAREELLESIPNLEEYFKSLVKSPEWLNQIVENYLARSAGDESSGSNSSGTEDKNSGHDHNASRGSSQEDSDSSKAKSIEDAFADLDEDEEDPF